MRRVKSWLNKTPNKRDLFGVHLRESWQDISKLLRKEDNPLLYNEGHLIEGLNSCHTIEILLEELLLEHPAVKKCNGSRLVITAMDAISELYQKIGAEFDE